MTKHGFIHYNERNTWDPEPLKEFYAKTLGWTFEEIQGAPDTPPYTLCKSGDAVVAGMFTYHSPMFDGGGEFWLTFIAVDDVDVAAAEVANSGGHVRRPPFDVPGVGRICVFDDAKGATMGIVTPVEYSA